LNAGAEKIPAAAAVLAGGGSLRMGRDKASLPWGEVPLGLFVADRLSAWFEEVIIASNREMPFRGGPFRVVADAFPGKGALGGLHGALSAVRRDWMFLVACDMPFIVEDLVRRLWSLHEGFDAVVASKPEGLEPLCAFYARCCLDPAARALQANKRRVAAFFHEIRLRQVAPGDWSRADPEGRSFVNINTPEEYTRALARWEAGRRRRL